MENESEAGFNLEVSDTFYSTEVSPSFGLPFD